MTAEENKKLAMKWNDAFNSHNLAVIDALVEEMWAPKWPSHRPNIPSDSSDRAGMKQWVRQLFKDVPDIHVHVEDLIAEGDKVVLREKTTGTYAVTKEPFGMYAIYIARMADGKVVEIWNFDIPEQTPPPAAQSR